MRIVQNNRVAGFRDACSKAFGLRNVKKETCY